MKYNKLLYGGGASLAVDPEKNFKFSLGNFKEKVTTNPDFKAAFMSQVMPYLKSTVMKPQQTTNSVSQAADDILATPGLYEV
jgi:hypothetical protein